ncbi:MAG: ABC transporter substrate-binding protein [Acidimicrobiia bacterium]|nr:ABC transporter substrate-binding protein [Acidimicrobiia bacterium]
MTPTIDGLLASDVLDDIRVQPLQELRELRNACVGVEGDVSMVRRLTQGRLDIVIHEARRRSGDGVAGLLFDLPDILADETRAAHTPGARPDVRVDPPGEAGGVLVERLEAIASPTVLSGVQHLEQDQLDELFSRISEFEQELSRTRRALHERIDAIQSEIGRRYRDGETTVDAVLGSDGS